MEKITENAEQARMNGYLLNLAKVEAKGFSLSNFYARLLEKMAD